MGIRKAELKDIASLVILCRKTFYETYSWYNTPSDMDTYMDTHFSESQLMKELERNDASYFVFEDAGQLSGYVELQTGREPAETKGRKSIEIARYYVDSAFQGRKIGKQLIEFCFDFAGQQEYELIWLGVWKKNTRAIEIYRHFGFMIAGTTKFRLGEDEQEDFIMVKELHAGNFKTE